MSPRYRIYLGMDIVMTVQIGDVEIGMRGIATAECVYQSDCDTWPRRNYRWKKTREMQRHELTDAVYAVC